MYIYIYIFREVSKVLYIIYLPNFYKYIIKVKLMKSAYKVLNQADKTIILNPQKPLFSLIWLHGLGDSSAGFFDYFQSKPSPLYHGGRIKLLHAPFRPVTVNGGMKCPSWYDIKSLDFGGKGDQGSRCSLKEVSESLEILDKKVQEQVEFWKNQKVQGDLYKRIFVGGFSQGCAISVLYGLTSKNILAGVIGFSGYLFQSFDLPNKGKIPLLLNHGSMDSMIPFQVSKGSYQKIISQPNVKFQRKQLDHEVSIEQVQEMSQWILAHLKNNK